MSETEAGEIEGRSATFFVEGASAPASTYIAVRQWATAGEGGRMIAAPFI